MRLASVIVDVPARSIDRAFDYLVPDELGGVAVGCTVSVDFGNRPVVGYVVAVRELPRRAYEDGGADASKLKALLGVLADPCFDETAVRLASWIAREYLCPPPDALRLFTPPGASPKIKRVDGRWELVRADVGPVDERWASLTEAGRSFEPAGNAVKQRAVMDALRNGAVRVPELSASLGQVASALKALERRGVVCVERRRRMRAASVGLAESAPVPQQLTRGQREALDAIASARGVVVVDGITGSGKTEVYLQAIANVRAAGRGAIVLVPEIALTPQTVGRFRARFGGDVAVLHSKLSAGERYDQWDRVRSGDAHVVVGTRSALFAPMHDVGLVVIDEEHDASYKQDCAPRYRARDVALRLAEARGAVLVLGSATSSIETLSSCGSHSVDGRAWTRVRLPERPGGARLPQVTVVDMGREFKGGSRSMFSKALTDALFDVHERKKKAVLLLNRRGFASFLLCRECGYVPECPNCAVSLTYHERGSMLACHHCEHVEAAPARCPECGSPYLRKFGTGTERVEAELRALLPDDMPVTRMDADTVKGKGGHERLLAQFAGASGGVLLGTQMIAKGLDFPEVALVGVINADTTLKLPDFRAPERTYQLLEQVSGRAGRSDDPGRVIVQTYWPEHPAIRAAAAHERSLFLDGELELRRELGYPPYARLANVLVWGEDEAAVRQRATQFALALNATLASAGLEWTVLGPTPCVLARLRGVYRWHILVKAPPETDMAAVLGDVLAKLARVRGDSTRVAVDIDPADVL